MLPPPQCVCYLPETVNHCMSPRFSDSHEFEKPNDANALKLMNRCAEEVMKEFQDLILAYGQSDEYR